MFFNMEEVIRTRLKLMYESVLKYIEIVQRELKSFENGDGNFNELELNGVKLKGANDRFVADIQNYCKSATEPNVDEVRQYTTIQIQAEDLISEVEVIIRRNHRKRDVATTSGTLNISRHLPRMELPKFDGDVLKWYQFWDQFSSNIHDRNISDVDKLLYLQSVLEGNAKQAIEGLDTTHKNYTIAVNTLKERFGKPSVIIDAHYVALYRIKTATSNQVNDCRQVLNEIERHLRVLSSLGEDVNHNHLRVMIIEKFPEDLIYELRMKLTEEEESIDNIRKYLEYIISARETSNRFKKDTAVKDPSDNINEDKNSENFTVGTLHVRSEVNKNNIQRRYSNYKREGFKSNFANKDKNNFDRLSRKRPHENFDKTNEPPIRKTFRSCIFCKENHYNDECKNYKTIEERRSRLGNRCFNCFSEDHKTDKCNFNNSCRHCGIDGHNRALCPKAFTN